MNWRDVAPLQPASWRIRRAYLQFRAFIRAKDLAPGHTVDVRTGRDVVCENHGKVTSADDRCPRCGYPAVPATANQKLLERIRFARLRRRIRDRIAALIARKAA